MKALKSDRELPTPEKMLAKYPASTKRVRKDHEACRQVA